ncbi:pseudouridine synthase [Pseudofulvibacter geojedonensis]|uniref:Pseudouridine synthase n=1 Tax=Pseudofulvibacter geojedonensis TaxID=1123758 RepID=A0ABW3HYZ3_9FLAO
MSNTYIIYKPFNMLSQFTKEAEHHNTLADLEFDFPKDVYPVGRLDSDSEGLLILTNDKSLNQKLLNPKNKKPKIYWVFVEGIPSEESLKKFRNGLTISIKGKKHQTDRAKVKKLKEVSLLPIRVPNIITYSHKEYCWLQVTLTEGKYRQVRKMCAAIGHPVLRLVRVGIANYTLGKGKLKKLQPGSVKELTIKI